MIKEKHERGVLNTTIDKEILSEFRSYCKDIGCPMNLILEAFMFQFYNGQFSLRLGKNNKMKVDIEE